MRKRVPSSTSSSLAGAPLESKYPQSSQTTAEVACPKAKYLAEVLNGKPDEVFKYQQSAIVAYLGQNDGVVTGKNDYTGAQTWIAWRSKNFLLARAWRQKVLIIIGWALNLVTGRSIAPR
jgi:NADH:ubiquinone reductase (non-electrogenic)